MFQRWFNALTDHIGFATHFIHAGERQEGTDNVPIATIDEAFQVIKGECKIDNKPLLNNALCTKPDQNPKRNKVRYL